MQKDELTFLISDVTKPFDQISKISKDLENIVEKLEEKEFRWLELSELV